MSRFISQALTNQPVTVYGNGKQTRSFCYIIDNIIGLLLLTACSKAKGETVNIGNSREVSILELAEKVKEITKSKSTIEFQPLPKDDPKRRCPHTGKIESLIGWKANVNFEDGLKRTITWFSART
jgi:nucleoside-diphosphate-sugar epimerase